MPYINAQQLIKFDPLPADHPTVGEICLICDKPLEAGQCTTLLFDCVIHWDCADLFDAIEV